MYLKTSGSIVDESTLIQEALRCLETRLRYNTSHLLDTPEVVKAFCRLQLGGELNEVFGVIFLNNANRLIAFEKLFFGSINSTRVHPRVVVQRAITLNAASVIFVHNHPSGEVNPSSNDRCLTNELKTILKIIDVSVIDHIIVSASDSYSFAESGLL